MTSNSGSPSLGKVSVIGLGKLGAPLAACLASKGYEVIGVDVNPKFITLINNGEAPVFEPGLKDLIQSSSGLLSATEDFESAISDTNMTFIVVPTPSAAHGGFSTKYVLQACQSIGPVLRKKDTFHLVVLTSTVLPGASEHEIKPALEASSGKRCGLDFGLCYSPEFIALGSAIRDFLNPDFLLIGESDPRSGELLSELYQNVCDNNPPIARMNFVNAELAKLSVNTFVTTKITFANMLARMCEQLPGANVDVVTSAIGLDSRIGAKYLKGAMGYGGPCFPRDNEALAFLATEIGAQATLAEATSAANRAHVPRLVGLIESKLSQGGRVGVLGLSYKPFTDVVEESQGLLLAQSLMAKGIPITVYDPAAARRATALLQGDVIFATSANDCCEQSDLIVLATPWPEFQDLQPEALARSSKPRVMIDCWRMLDGAKFQSAVEYVPLGIGLEGFEWLGDQPKPLMERT